MFCKVCHKDQITCSEAGEYNCFHCGAPYSVVALLTWNPKTTTKTTTVWFIKQDTALELLGKVAVEASTHSPQQHTQEEKTDD